MIKKYLENIKTTIDNLDIEEINEFINLLYKAHNSRKNIFVMGNGGSATTASHFACDLNKLSNKFKVLSLNDNIPTILAYANDMTYEDIFVEQIKNFIEADDIVVGISGSGNSANILKAIEYANSVNAKTIGLTGYKNGKLKYICNYSVNANIDDMQIAEDIHLMVVHIVMRSLDKIINKALDNHVSC